MGVERPERDRITVNVDTLGAVARELRTLEGLTDWAGHRNADVCFGDYRAFAPVNGLADAQGRALRTAWAVVQRIEKINIQYAGAVARAARAYDATDRGSAEALEAVARGMRDPGRER